ncbi:MULTISPECIES: 3-keto-5-aminohexanoate cleavage protein [Mesorhizobium]|uniref:Uncharacterized protein n=1 Tax=Mesorhizobium amorphae CCNWGS0123 TaxID=1082933 RepID=G6Y8B5_9HYPH|nr:MULTISPECIES: 3-keto-5-aminohexanoate cleavage protein [Mesorhizobium]ANT54698.1 hypothetical protein A6B35_32445 [Mesorhizobium amorphae CCNWGS0123]EHH12015.1 hypothetical protein MEA186_10911 [Mesorhizobium amorphae CCNWGS0123]MCV3211046.1 3-keto-5-aminohexanoate cleavage protein [Mesorhizobium sp. YC-2]MCV3232771.1 3-keto-5-aminohexanoate cleavage protein [Mesorhizobium sp. YC-39]
MQSYVLGGDVRIGMEDTTQMSLTELVKSNAELVEKAKWHLERLGAPVAGPASGQSRLSQKA